MSRRPALGSRRGRQPVRRWCYPSRESWHVIRFFRTLRTSGRYRMRSTTTGRSASQPNAGGRRSTNDCPRRGRRFSRDHESERHHGRHRPRVARPPARLDRSRSTRSRRTGVPEHLPFVRLLSGSERSLSALFWPGSSTNSSRSRRASPSLSRASSPPSDSVPSCTRCTRSELGSSHASGRSTSGSSRRGGTAGSIGTDRASPRAFGSTVG